MDNTLKEAAFDSERQLQNTQAEVEQLRSELQEKNKRLKDRIQPQSIQSEPNRLSVARFIHGHLLLFDLLRFER